MARRTGVGGPTLKAPAIQLTVRIGETIDDILTVVFIMSPYSAEKALELETLLGAPDIEFPQRDELRNLLISIGEGPPTGETLTHLLDLLSALQESVANLDRTRYANILASYPIHVVMPPFDEQKASQLQELLAPLGSYDELIGYLIETPSTGSDMLKFKQLLTNLQRDARAPNFPIPAEQIDQNIPIALVGPTEISELKKMTYADGSLIFDLINRVRLYDAVSIILQLGYYDGKAFLSNVKTPSDLLFNAPIPSIQKARERQFINLRIMKTKPEVRGESVFTCSKCRSKNILSSEKQIRSADEPATIFLTCQNCGNHWRIG